MPRNNSKARRDKRKAAAAQRESQAALPEELNQASGTAHTESVRVGPGTTSKVRGKVVGIE